MSAEVVIEVLVKLFNAICFVWDVIVYFPYNYLYNPQRRLLLSNRIKARSVEGSFDGPYRTVDHIQGLSTSLFPECQTLDDLFRRAVDLHGSLPALGTRELLSEADEVQPNGKTFKKSIFGEYYWQTFEEVYTRIGNFGEGLCRLGQKPKQNICIFAETRAEWMICAQACFRNNFPVVTLYATLGEEAIVHGVNESEVSIVITSSELLPKFKNILDRISRVRTLVYFEGRKAPVLDEFPDGVEVQSMGEVEALGALEKKDAMPISKPVRDDIAVIMYTSGSTGLPKGVIISHGNLMCGVSGQCQRIPNLGTSDTYIGYLPLAHVLELSAEMSCLASGVRIGYSSPLTLSDQSSKIKKGSKGDATQLRPTLMAAVPVIMDRLYKAVWEKVNDGGLLSRAIFRFAYEHKKRRLTMGYDTPVHNRVVFHKIAGLLGGNLRMLLTGGAPLSADTQRFMNICFCCPVGQGYGLTETCGAGTIHETTDLSTGRVGAPLQCNEIRLRNWEEGGYTVDDKPYPRGEIMLGGGNVAMGYYKNPEKTAEDFVTIKGVRYFCTGDIGLFEADGCLRIVGNTESKMLEANDASFPPDRKKDLVKLQAGEYVSLSKVETAIKLCPLVDNCCLYADSSQHYTICLVVPNAKQLRAVAEKIGIENDGEWDDLCENEDLEKEVMKAIQEYSVKGKLERFEIPLRLKLCSELWVPESGLVTDAFKLKRKNIQTHYQSDINRMYA